MSHISAEIYDQIRKQTRAVWKDLDELEDSEKTALTEAQREDPYLQIDAGGYYSHHLRKYREERQRENTQPLRTAATAVYEEIKEQSRGVWRGLKGYQDFNEAAIAEAQQKYPHLQIDIAGYYIYHADKASAKRQQELAQLPFTARQLFETAYYWDPMGPTGGKDLHVMLGNGRFERIILGKLRGQTYLDLLPAIGILHSTKLPDDCTQLDVAYTDGGAISYKGGYPFEDHKEKQPAPEEGPLRRLMTLGWVIRRDSEEYTGHVLVMDMDEGRDRHPWFVLASEWPDDEEILGTTDMTFYAEKHVNWNNRNAYGVLPWDNNRTTVARLRANPERLATNSTLERSATKPMLLQFGPDFEFDLETLGITEEEGLRTGRGPELANIMHWYDDAATGEEVCFGPDGKECMRYNRHSKQYQYGDAESEAWRPQLSI